MVTRFGDSTACSLLEYSEEIDTMVEVEEQDEVKTVPLDVPLRVKAKAPSQASPSSANPFKADDQVLYDGQQLTVIRAYMYKDKPYCILSNKKQVSATKLQLNKMKK